MTKATFALLLSFASASPGVIAADVARMISGPAYVIDGDPIAINGQHIRLNGIDAPKLRTRTTRFDDPFGPESRDEMRSIIDDQIVRCELNGERSYERVVGVCFLPDGVDTGAELIRRGLALDCAHWSGGRYRALEPTGVREIIAQAPYC